MASQIYDGIGAALSDCFNVTGQVFTWQGKDYGCSLNVESATLVTSKALFSGAIPKAGDVITVVNFEGACLDVPFLSTKDNADLDFEAHTDRIPPRETAVSVILEPVVEKKKK